MDRTERILAHVDQGGRGLEIGPSHQPIAPKSKGFNVEIIDHLDREGLIAKYDGHGVATEQIEEVDHIWGGESYLDLTGGDSAYDWIIASHVIEHVPDFIGFLKSCQEVLKPGGVISLALPDHRYCFDAMREATSLAQLLDSHLDGRAKPSAGTIAEFMLFTAKRDGALSWAPTNAPAEWEYIHTLEQSRDFFEIARNIEDSEYRDAHVWCFTPATLHVALDSFAFLELVDLEVVEVSVGGAEIYAVLRRREAGTGTPAASIDRSALHEARVAERAEPGAELALNGTALNGTALNGTELNGTATNGTVPAEQLDAAVAAAVEVHVTAATAENDQLRAQVAALEEEIRLTRATKSYRLVEPLRRLERARKAFLEPSA